jgi:hypothetical protein
MSVDDRSRQGGAPKARPAVERDTKAGKDRQRDSQPGAKAEDTDGPLDSLGRAVTDTVTGSLPEEVPGATNPDPDDPARP